MKSKVFSPPFVLALVAALAVAAFTLAGPVSANPGDHYYVDADNGSDSNDGSAGSPWKTISHAVDNVPAGNSATDPNVIHVESGTYDNTTNGETFPITFDTPNVTLLADGSTTDPVIDGEAAYTILEIEDTGITIDGFVIKNATNGIEADCGAFSILNNTFSNTSDWDLDDGVHVSLSECNLDADFAFDSILIEDNEFNITSDGVYLYFDIDFDDSATDLDIGDIDIFDNDFNMNDTDGIDIFIGVSDVCGGDVTIGDIDISDGNTFSDGDRGVYFDSQLEDLDDATVEIGDLMINDNTFTDQNDYAVFIDTYYYANASGYGDNNWRGDTTVTIGDIEVNENNISSTQAICRGIYIYRYGYWEYAEDDVVVEAGGIYIEDNDPIDVEGNYGIYVEYYFLEYWINNAELTLGDVSIQDNVITAGTDGGDYGIYLDYDDVGYDFNGDTSFTSGDFYISGNEITDCGADAVYVYFDNFGYDTDNNAVVTLGDLYIEENEIGTTTEAGSDGIHVVYYDFYDLYDYSQVRVGDVHIEDNGPINANDYGVYLYYYDLGYDVYNNAQITVGDAYIVNNTGIDVTDNDGIYVEYENAGYDDFEANARCTFGDLFIEGNEIGSDGDNVGRDGIYLEYDGCAYQTEDDSVLIMGSATINDNDIYANDDGMYIYYYHCGYYMEDDSTATFGDLSIEGNDIYSANDADTYAGIYIYYQYSAYENENNTVATYGDLNIIDNDIEAAGDDGIYLEMKHFGASLDGSARVDFGDVNILENDAIDAEDYGVYLYFGVDFGYDLDNNAVFTAGDVNVRDNVITANNEDGIYTHYHSGYYIYENASWSVGDLNIEGNDVTSASNDGIYVYYDHCTADVHDSAITRIGNASICNNGIDAGCGYGVYLEYHQVGYYVYDHAQVFVGSADISGNHAVGDANEPLTSTSDGIHLYYYHCGNNTYDYSQVNFGNVTMWDNLIDSAMDGIEVYYYYVGYEMDDSSDTIIGTLDIADNTIDASYSAIYFYYDEVAYEMDEDDIPCEATLTMDDISVRDNTFNGDGAGIYIEYDDDEVSHNMYDDAYAKLPSYVITGNTFNVTRNGIELDIYEIPYDIYDNTTIDFGGFLIDDNVFNGEARNIADPMNHGIYLDYDDICYSSDDYTTTILGDVTITNNEFYDLAFTAVYVYYNDIGDELYDYAVLEVGDLEIAANTIDGANNGIQVYYYWIESYNDSTATMGNLDITGNNLSNITTDGIYLYYRLDADGNSSQTIGRALVQDNILDGSSDDGIYVYMDKDAEAGATITLGEPIIDGNIITEWLHGIYLEDVDGATVTNNFIMDNNSGITLDGSDNIDISNNDILQNRESTSGVHLNSDCGPDTTINYNNIVANIGYGVFNACAHVIDAENNWWGDPSGPDDDAGVINGTGDRISLNVDADPWLTQQSNVCIYEETITATASGIASVQTDGGAIIELEPVAEGTLPDAGKPNLTFPHGFFSFTIIGLDAGQEVTATLTLPGNMPVGTEYWKYGPTTDDPTDHWYSIPIGDDDGDNVITIPLVDGGLGDNDLTANGTIEEPGAPGYLPPAAPAVEEEEEVVPRRRVQAAAEDEEPTGIARFNVTNLYVTPSEVPPDQIVNVSADVTNIGSERGAYDAILYVNGEKQGGHTVHLYPGASQRVLFQVARPTPGTYRVSVANQSGWFTVNDTEFNVVVAPPEAASGGLGTPAIIAIVLGSVAVGVGIYFARRRSAY